MHKKWIQNRENCDGLPKTATRRLPRRRDSEGAEYFQQFWEFLWASQNIKNRHFPKNPIPGSVFLTPFYCECCLHQFLDIFSLIFDEKFMEILLFFKASVVFLSTWQPSRNTVFYISKRTFHFFRLL